MSRHNLTQRREGEREAASYQRQRHRGVEMSEIEWAGADKTCVTSDCVFRPGECR